MSHIKELFVILILLVSARNAVASDLPQKNNAMEEAAAEAAEVKVTPEILERVKGLMETIETPEWKARMKEMQRAAAAPLGIDVENEQATRKKRAGAKDRLYVFISKTIPLETLRNYARDLEKVPGGVMVLRGFIENGRKLAPTARFVASILRKDRDCEGLQCEMRRVEIQIDPFLFRKYQVTRVPAVTFEENLNPEGYCSVNVAELVADTNMSLVQGDAALLYAVETMYRETKKPALKQIIDRLEGKG